MAEKSSGERSSRRASASAGYLRGLDGRVQLDDAAERQLVEAARGGDDRALEALIEAFLPRISAVAAHYRTGGVLERTELVQEGVVGLLRALRRFDPGRGTPFWAYAVWWVRQAMQQLVSELTGPLVLSDRAMRGLSRLRRAQEELVREGDADPSLARLAKQAGLEAEQAGELLAAGRPARSLEEPASVDGASLTSLGSLIEDPEAEGEFERALDRVEGTQLGRMLGELSGREQEVLRARHGEAADERTLTELGAEMGVSGERVRQIEERALAKLRTAAPEDP